MLGCGSQGQAMRNEPRGKTEHKQSVYSTMQLLRSCDRSIYEEAIRSGKPRTNRHDLHFEQCYDLIRTDEAQHLRLYLPFNV